MAIAFTQIPANLLVPGQYQEIDNSLAGAQGDIKTVLAIGMKAKTGKAPAGVLVNVVSAAQAKEAFGFGSPAAIMAEHRGRRERSFINTTEFRPLHVCSSQTCGKRDFFKPRISRQTEYDNEFGSSKLGRTARPVNDFTYHLCSPRWNGCRKDCGGCRCRLQWT